jgi:hypothetical protein
MRQEESITPFVQEIPNLVGLQLQFCKRTLCRPLTALRPFRAAFFQVHILVLSIELREERVHIRWERVDDFAHFVRLEL